MFVIPIHDLSIDNLSAAIKDLTSNVDSVNTLHKYLRRVDVYLLKTSQLVEPPDVVASDSSRVARMLSLATVYVIQAASLKASLRSPSASRLVVKPLAGYYIPTYEEVIPHELLGRILQLASKALEVRVTIENVDGCSIALFDGSLISFLWGYGLREIPKTFYPHNYKSIKDLWYDISSGIIKILKYVRPLFISKTPIRSYYIDKILSDNISKDVKDKVNDLLLINALRGKGELPKTPYLLDPVYVEYEKLPEPLNRLNVDFLKPLLPITITYVSFNPSTYPYQVSIPGRLEPDELVDLISTIYPYSYSGYPDPLKVIHSKCKLTNAEFRAILYKLGVSSIPTGRELLGEFL